MPGIDQYTKLMLHADGDESPVKNTVTLLGGAAITPDQAKIGDSSLRTGSGAYATAADDPSLDFGGGDFTIDWWQYALSTSGTVFTRDGGESGTYSGFLIGHSASFLLYMSSSGFGWDIASAVSLGGFTLNEWVHYAIVRSGTNFYTFKNGVQVSNWTRAQSLYAGNSEMRIGRDRVYSTYFNGYLDGIRFIKGTALWTSGFTPPTTRQAVDANTSLQLYFDGDTSGQAHEVVSSGSPVLNAAVSKWNGSLGVAFTGSSNVRILDSADWNLGDTWTLEAWVRFSSITSTRGAVVGRRDTVGAKDNWMLSIDGGATKDVRVTIDGTNYYNSDDDFPLDTWVHVAATLDGAGNLRLFQDGQLVRTDTGVASPPDTTGDVYVGFDGNDANSRPTGNIDEIRISKGIARWVESFTPPTQPYDSSPEPTPPSPPVYPSTANRLRLKNSFGSYNEVGIWRLSQLLDGDISYPEVGDILFFDGERWVNAHLGSNGSIDISYDEANHLLVFGLAVES